MKTKFALLLALILTLLCATALAGSLDGVTPEENTMVALIDGKPVTLYLFYGGDVYSRFKSYNEDGETDMEFTAYMGVNTKKGTYNGFSKNGIDRCWLNTDYTWIYKPGKTDAEYTQYVGGNYSGTRTIGGNGRNIQANNQAEIDLRITKSTGYRIVGEFEATLHNVKKDTFIPIEAKFDYTVGEHFDENEAKRRCREAAEKAEEEESNYIPSYDYAPSYEIEAQAQQVMAAYEEACELEQIPFVFTKRVKSVEQETGHICYADQEENVIFVFENVNGSISSMTVWGEGEDALFHAVSAALLVGQYLEGGYVEQEFIDGCFNALDTYALQNRPAEYVYQLPQSRNIVAVIADGENHYSMRIQGR